MKKAFFKYTFKGEYTTEDVQLALDDMMIQGFVVRLDNMAGKTHLYIAAHDPYEARKTMTKAIANGVSIEEVDSNELMSM